MVRMFRRFFRFLADVMEELDRNLENGKAGLSAIDGTVKPGTKR
jgi:hypothetical protein